MQKLFAQLKGSARAAMLFLSIGLLAGPAFANEAGPERLIHLQGSSNTRDIGGYPAADLRTVRWRQIIRSENLSRLTAGDFQELEAIGVKTVIDLRTGREHERKPTHWQGDHPPRFYHFPIGNANQEWFKDQRKMMKRNRFTEKQSRAHMVEGYRVLAEVGEPSLKQLMEVVLEPDNWPILIHCNAGKDRAAIAVTLILEALGVEREVIMQDYLLTNEAIQAEKKAAFMAREMKHSSAYGSRTARSPSASAWFPFIGVQAEMLEAFYSSIDEHYGSMDAFLTELGADPEARQMLVASLTTPKPEWALHD